MGAMGKAPGSKTPGEKAGDHLGKAPSMASIAENAALAGVKGAAGSASQPGSARVSSESGRPQPGPRAHPLKYEWVTWCRPCQPKGQPYEEYAKSLTPMVHCKTAEEFVVGFRHLKHPSQLPVGWEYHFFKRGIRPIWEDEINRSGGKWVLRLKKGIADRYWEDTRFALLGEAFSDVSEEICGGVVSIRNGEDVISIWTRSTGGRVLKIRYVTSQHRLAPVIAADPYFTARPGRTTSSARPTPSSSSSPTTRASSIAPPSRSHAARSTRTSASRSPMIRRGRRRLWLFAGSALWRHNHGAMMEQRDEERSEASMTISSPNLRPLYNTGLKRTKYDPGSAVHWLATNGSD
jgi:hypothetical protein